MPGLPSLRFVAALAVLLLRHYRDLPGPMPAWLRQGIVGGPYGGASFFVLSGFILPYRAPAGSRPASTMRAFGSSSACTRHAAPPGPAPRGGGSRWRLEVAAQYSGFIAPFTGLILAIASGRTWFSAALPHPWPVRLGEANYRLCMSRWPVISFLALGVLGTPLVDAAFRLATVGAAVVCYQRVEPACRAWLQGTSVEGRVNQE